MDERELSEGLVDGFARDVRVNSGRVVGRDCLVEFVDDGVMRVSMNSDVTGDLHCREFEFDHCEKKYDVYSWIGYLECEGLISSTHAHEVRNWVAQSIWKQKYHRSETKTDCYGKVFSSPPEFPTRPDSLNRFCVNPHSPRGAYVLHEPDRSADDRNIGRLNQRRFGDFVVDAIIVVAFGSFIYAVVELAQWGNW
jgi:hypothetical protein